MLDLREHQIKARDELRGMMKPSTGIDFDNLSTFLGRRVRVTLEQGTPDGGNAVIAEGVLVSYDDSGQVVVQDEMGFAHFCWPMLDIEVVDE